MCALGPIGAVGTAVKHRHLNFLQTRWYSLLHCRSSSRRDSSMKRRRRRSCLYEDSSWQSKVNADPTISNHSVNKVVFRTLPTDQVRDLSSARTGSTREVDLKSIQRMIATAALSFAGLSIVFTGLPIIASGTASASTATCFSSSLTAKSGRASGAAGTTYFNLEIINHSLSNCSLSGTPVSLPGNVPKSGPHWVSTGPQSVKISYAGRGGTVVIKPGRVASVELGVSTAGNYSPATCRPKMITGVEIVFANAKSPVYLQYRLPKQAVCTKIASTSIAGVALGTHFP